MTSRPATTQETRPALDAPQLDGRVDVGLVLVLLGIGVAFSGFVLGAYVSLGGIAMFAIGLWKWK